MAERFFLDRPVEGDFAELTGQESQHLVRVLRARVGDQIVVFDGLGAEYVARVERLAQRSVNLAIVERREADRESPVSLTLGVALPKGDRQRWLVEKVVELGVAALVPLCTERSVAVPGDAARTRLRRTVIEASKQCGRNRLMRVGEPAALVEFFSRGADQAGRYLAHPNASDANRLASSQLRGGPTAETVCIAVGPEGGFTDSEVGCGLERGWQLLDLGPRILRVETAAVAAATLVLLGSVLGVNQG